MITTGYGERNVLIVVCAIGAGIHAALTPEHFAEGTGAGLGFLAATVLLAATAVALTRRASPMALGASAVVLIGLVASYLLATTTGLPLLHPDVEPVDSLALATKAIELVGLFAAIHLLARDRPAVTATHLQPKGSLT